MVWRELKQQQCRMTSAGGSSNEAGNVGTGRRRTVMREPVAGYLPAASLPTTLRRGTLKTESRRFFHDGPSPWNTVRLQVLLLLELFICGRNVDLLVDPIEDRIALVFRQG